MNKNGDALSFGRNHRGQLGIGIFSDKEYLPNFVRLRNSDEKIQKVFCGLNHSCFITKTGKVFSTGENTYGQLGLGH